LATPGQVRDFATLRSLWGNCLSEEAFERLRRINTKTIDESLLSEMVEVRLETLIEGDTTTITEVLFRLALDRMHQELGEHDLTRHLEERSFRRRNWANDDLVLAKLEEANLRYLSPIRDELISTVSILREETSAVLSSLTSTNGRRGILLVGEAGVGKSGVVMQALEKLREQKVPILAFRVDRLDPTPLPNDIGRQLELPGSPVAVLASVAQGQECVLIIDQLDAVSLASGRHP
jgi:ATP-dependent Clp protease ATP-binding subunit ClpA